MTQTRRILLRPIRPFLAAPNDTDTGHHRSSTPMALLSPTTTGSTPLSQYHSLDPSPVLPTSTLSSASSSSASLTAEDEGKHGSLFAICLPCSGLEASRVFGNLREMICHASHYREHHDHCESRFAPKTQGKTEESGVSAYSSCLLSDMVWWSMLKRALSFRDIRLLAVSTHITELSYAISDVQTRIFGSSSRRARSADAHVAG